MRILVIGATGGSGREIVKQALERGHDVVAFARTPSKVKITHARLRVAQGDVMKPETLDAAMNGVDAVVCALGHKRWLGPSNIQSAGTRNIVRAMEKHGIKRLVVETSLGVGDSFGRLGVVFTLFTMPVILPFYFYDKLRQERVVRASSLDWVIVRPGNLLDGGKRGRYRHGPRVGNYLWGAYVKRADVADFMLNQLGETPYLRQSPGLAY